MEDIEKKLSGMESRHVTSGDKMFSIQVRVPAQTREEASKVLKDLGLDLATYVNMSLARLAAEKRIPQGISGLSQPEYTHEEAVDEVKASMTMEGFTLDHDDLDMLDQFSRGKLSGDEIRRRILHTI